MNGITKAILKDVEDTLEAAKFGLEDFKNSKGPRKFSGLRNLVVFGRSVTLVIQNLKGKIDGFESWYEKHRAELKQDDVMRFFVELRNSILKEGSLKTSVLANITFSAGDLRKYQPAPPGAVNFFIGDIYGGSGWIISHADGTTDKYYVDLPEENCKIEHYFSDIPKKFTEAVENREITELSELYIKRLTEIVKDCRSFVTNS